MRDRARPKLDIVCRDRGEVVVKHEYSCEGEVGACHCFDISALFEEG
jgi:hypothetical protein